MGRYKSLLECEGAKLELMEVDCVALPSQLVRRSFSAP